MESKETSPIIVFDRPVLFARRARLLDQAKSTQAHFLHKELFGQLLDRVDDFNRTFDNALIIDGHGLEYRLNHPKIKTAIHATLFDAAADIVIDEEAMPFAPQSFDLVISNLNLHMINDVPGTLLQIRNILKPDGLLIISLFGGQTLHELRHSLTEAELQVKGGVSPRVSPFANIQDIGMLLQRAGFALPVIDSELLTATYETIFDLMKDLRLMGESNAIHKRHKSFTGKEMFLKAGEIYQQTFADAEGRLPATFEVIQATAWTPHENQQQPLKPGSATQKLAAALGTEEISAGEKAGSG